MIPDVKQVTGTGPVLRILHLHLEVGQQSEANQFLYPSRHKVDVATYFPCRIEFPDRIRLFDGDGTFGGFKRALRAAEEAGPYDIVHAHGPIDGMLYWWFCHLRGRRLGRTLYGAHHSFTNSNFKRRNRILSYGTFALFERVVCVSAASLASFPPRFHRLARGRLSVVCNGVDLTRLDETVAPMEKTQEQGGFHVASVGRLIEIKNPLAILRAFAGVDDPSARLTFAGNGALEDELRTGAANDARVTVAGELAREDVFRLLYGTADLYVSASRGEGMPMAPLEAMASGCPVILSDIEPHREIAEGSDFIPLFAPDDVEALTREIDRYRRMAPELRREIGEKCRTVVEARFSLQGMHEGYDRVYYDLCGLETSDTVVDSPRRRPGGPGPHRKPGRSSRSSSVSVP
ncbi:MAG: glycosyltransferase family 4 protein [Gemmatimonadetes bacterium]|nr:glycosyltransferase family 4 protein [Gemmatimonadota bacterium]